MTGQRRISRESSHHAYGRRGPGGALRRWRVRRSHKFPYDFVIDYYMPPRPVLLGEPEPFWMQVAGGYRTPHEARREAAFFYGEEFEEAT